MKVNSASNKSSVQQCDTTDYNSIKCNTFQYNIIHISIQYNTIQDIKIQSLIIFYITTISINIYLENSKTLLGVKLAPLSTTAGDARQRDD